jgi:hypothetical protein
MAAPTSGLPLPAAAFEPRCIVAASRFGNGAEGAGYNFHYCMEGRLSVGQRPFHWGIGGLEREAREEVML